MSDKLHAAGREGQGPRGEQMTTTQSATDRFEGIKKLHAGSITCSGPGPERCNDCWLIAEVEKLRDEVVYTVPSEPDERYNPAYVQRLRAEVEKMKELLVAQAVEIHQLREQNERLRRHRPA